MKASWTTSSASCSFPVMRKAKRNRAWLWRSTSRRKASRSPARAFATAAASSIRRFRRRPGGVGELLEGRADPSPPGVDPEPEPFVHDGAERGQPVVPGVESVEVESRFLGGGRDDGHPLLLERGAGA